MGYDGQAERANGRRGRRAWRSEIADRKVTLRDVAAASGASMGTVSMALNHRSGVSSATRQRIQDVAQRLGYEGTAGRRAPGSSLVNVVVERLPVVPTSDPFNRDILLSLEATARRAGYRVALEFVGPEERPQTAHWTRESTAGIVILGGGDLGPEWVRAAVESDVPVVMVDHFVPGLELPTVVPDNVAGAHFATRHLLETGHERIGFIRGPSKYWTLGERMAGYLLAIQQSDAAFDEDLIPPRISHGDEKGFEEMRYLLDLPAPPTAVFAVSDKTAAGAYRAIGERGLSIPRDVSVVGFDNIQESGLMTPPLTTVDVPRGTLGSMAFYRLLSILENGDASKSGPFKWTIPTELVVRESVVTINARS